MPPMNLVLVERATYELSTDPLLKCGGTLNPLYEIQNNLLFFNKRIKTRTFMDPYFLHLGIPELPFTMYLGKILIGFEARFVGCSKNKNTLEFSKFGLS